MWQIIDRTRMVYIGVSIGIIIDKYVQLGAGGNSGRCA